MKLKSLKYLIIACALTLTGCITDEGFPDGGVSDGGNSAGGLNPDGTVRLELFTRTPDYDKPETRAGMAQDNAVGTTPWVLVFRGSDDNATYFEAAQAFSMAGKTFVNLTPTSSLSRLLVIANPQPRLTATTETEYEYTVDNFDNLLTGNTLAGASNLLHTQALTAGTHASVPFAGTTQATQMPLPMSGIYPATGTTTIGTNTSINLSLTRAVAKIVVVNTAANFTLQGATVTGTPRRGRLHRLGSTLRANTAADRTDYAEIVAAPANTTAANPIYVYESSKADALHTHVIVQGLYGGAVNYYKLSFRDPAATAANPNSTIDILRNNVYTFNIASVNRPGYTSFADAAAAAHSSNEDIVWRIDVSDPYAHDMVDNGEYYLGVSNSRFIVYGDGALTGKPAVTITTNCTKTLTSTDNSITASAGITITSPAGRKIANAVGATPGTTNVVISLDAAFVSGTVTLRLGDLVKVIGIERRPALSGVIPFEAFEGDYLSAEVESGVDWLSLSTDGVVKQGGYINNASEGNIYIVPKPNYGPAAMASPAKSGGVVYLSRRDETAGRIKLDITQKPAPITVPAGIAVLPYSYVGTFHRASEVGERNVRIPAAVGGKWMAEVVAGQNFIKIAGGLGAGWPTGANDAEANPVPGDAQKIWGTVAAGGEIRFRVGMRGKLSGLNPADTTAPRYGKIVVSYADYSATWEIFVRQGEAADYVMKPGESDGTGASLSNGRASARQISPYNLADPNWNDRTNIKEMINASTGLLPVRGGRWTDYPSQGGYHFYFNKSRHAFNTSGSDGTNWTTTPAADPIVPWNANTDETCPSGYRRPHYAVNFTDEMTQSLVRNPGESGHLTGYYADGFFDRRALDESGFSVATGSVYRAFGGDLYFNPTAGSLASIFLPGAGNHNSMGLYHNLGATLYWTDGTYFFFMNGNSENQTADDVALNIRCVKN